MKRYKTKLPRAAIGMTAVAMTAITFGLAVVVPAEVASRNQDAGAYVASRAVSSVPTEVAIIPARIEVIAVRDQATALVPARSVAPKQKQPS